MIEVTVKGAANLAKWLDAVNARERSALRVALKKEGFRLKRQLSREIEAGAPGGRAFAPLSVIRSRTKRDRWRVPLRRLAAVVRYAVNDRRYFSNKYGELQNPGQLTHLLVRGGGRTKDFGGTEVHIGFLDPQPFYGQSHVYGNQKLNLSKSWLRLARIHQEGFWGEMSEGARKQVLAMQGQVGPGLAKYFALRRTTRRFRTPARPIVAPFWQAQRSQALANIRANYRRKLAGERI